MYTTSVTNSSSSTSSSDVTNKKEIAKDQFLNLLVAQLQNQNPLEATDASKLADQLTQFGQLEQLFNLNETMETLSTVQENNERSQVMSYLGNQVGVQTDSLKISAENKGNLSFVLDQDADTVSVEIMNNYGKVVRTETYSTLEQGAHSYPFDGLDDTGKSLSEGEYQISVTAKNAKGQSIASTTLLSGNVDQIDFSTGDPLIGIDGQYYSLDQVISIQKGL